MEEQGTHEQHIPTCTGTKDWGNLGAPLAHRLACEPPDAVRPRENAHWTLLRSTVIEVHTDGEHPREERDWGLHMDDARFYGPRPKSWGHPLRLHRNGHVLMPWHLPIGRGRFIEHQGTDSETVWTQHRFHEGVDALGTGQPLHLWESLEEAHGRGTSVMLTGSLLCHTGKRVEERLPAVVGYHAFNHSKALLVDEIRILHSRF